MGTVRMITRGRQRLPRALGPVLLVLALAGCDSASKPHSSLEVAARSVETGAFSSDGAWAVIGSAYHGGSLWALDSGERRYDWNHKADDYTLMTSASFSPDGEFVLTADARTLVLWNRATGAAEQYWSSPSDIRAARLGPDGERALLGLADHRASLYNVSRGGILRNLHHSDRVNSVDISADGRWGLSGSEAGTVTLWDLGSGDPVSHQQHQSGVRLVSLSPEGERALSASRYELARIWNRNGELIWELPLQEERIKRGTQITTARFSDDGAYLLTGQPNGLVQLWDIDNRQPLYSWRLPKRKAWHPTAVSVLDVAFTEDPNLYRALSSDGFVHDLSY